MKAPISHPLRPPIGEVNRVSRLLRLAAEVATNFRHHLLSAIFPLFIFAALWVSPFATPPFLHRYDVLLLWCGGAQAAKRKE